MNLIHRAEQCASELFHLELGDADMTPRQFTVLAAISQEPGLSQTRLVETTGIDRSTIAAITRRLLKKGLVQRRRTTRDARAYAVSMTDLGWAALKKSDHHARRVDDKLLAALPPNARTRFIEDLSTIVNTLKPAVD